jgi:hypothetical protein
MQRRTIRTAIAIAAVVLAPLNIAIAVDAAAGDRRGSPRIVFVNASLTTGANDGTSWGDAHQGRLGLQQALSELPAETPAQIWIAAGEYAPASPNGDPAAHFAMRSSLALFGGFEGGETSLDQRDIQANPTILTGDLNSNDEQIDTGHWTNDQDNANNVVIAQSVDASAVLDGVSVRRGVARISALNRRQGGNIRIVSASPTVRLCTFEHGEAGSGGGGGGGGMGICGSSPLVEDCTFRANQSPGLGAGVYHTGSSSAIFRRCLFEANRGGAGAAFANGCMFWDCSFAACGEQLNTPLIQDCVFRDNLGFFGASSGIGILDWRGQPVIERCRFINNTTGAGGGGMYLRASGAIIRNCDFVGNEGRFDGGGALYVDGGSDGGGTTNLMPIAVNCRFIGNNGVVFANFGGAITLTNCTLAHNSLATQFPTAMWPVIFSGSDGSSVALRNCIMWGNGLLSQSGAHAGGSVLIVQDGSVTIDESCVEHWNDGPPLPGGNVFEALPLFIDAAGADGVLGTADDNVRLGFGSPCVDAGDNRFVPMDAMSDLDQQPRIVDGDGDELATVDLGPYERPRVGDVDHNGVVNVDDLVAVILAWGDCPKPSEQCPADVDGSGAVNVDDLVMVILNWG